MVAFCLSMSIFIRSVPLYIRKCFNSCFAISLIHIRNNRGPSTDPWVTRTRMDFIDRAQDLNVTFCFLLSR